MKEKRCIEFYMEKYLSEEKKKAIKKVRNFDELLDIEYGKIGMKERDEFEEKANLFVISEMLKASREEAKITQEQLQIY